MIVALFGAESLSASEFTPSSVTTEVLQPTENVLSVELLASEERTTREKWVAGRAFGSAFLLSAGMSLIGFLVVSEVIFWRTGRPTKAADRWGLVGGTIGAAAATGVVIGGIARSTDCPETTSCSILPAILGGIAGALINVPWLFFAI